MSEGANSENSFQNPEATRFSRRTFIRKAGESALGAAAFLYSRDSTLANGQTQEATQPVETEIASIEHAGWNFIVNLDELQSYTAQRGSTVQIDVIGGYGSKQPHIEYRQGKPDISNQCIRLNLDGKSTGVLEVLPNPHQEDILLSIKEIEGDTLINENPLTVPLETYTYRPEDEDDRERIFSEVLLDSDTLRELHEQAKRFDIFHNTSYPTYIFQPRYGVQTPIYHTEDNYIMIPAKYFENPDTLNQGKIVLDHERFHAAHTPATLESEEAQSADRELEAAHKEALTYITGEEANLGTEIFVPNEVRHHPIFQVFDESTYFPELRAVDVHDHGHPFSNYREFFASAMNCMEKASEEVIAHIDSIENPDDRQKAQELGQAAIHLAHSIAADEVLLNDAFPNIITVNNYFQTVK